MPAGRSLRTLLVVLAAPIAASLSFAGVGSGVPAARGRHHWQRAACASRCAQAGGGAGTGAGAGASDPRPHTLADTGRAGRELDWLRRATKVANAGRRTAEFTTDPLGRSVVNVPVYRASTVTFPNTTALRSRPRGVSDVWEGLFYGRFGSLTHRALEDAFATLEGGHRATVGSSVQAATASVLLGLLRKGDGVLWCSNASPRFKRFASTTLASLGIWSSTFPPNVSPNTLKALFEEGRGEGRGKVQVVVLQGISPPDLELVDLKMVASIAHTYKALVLYDNTWMSSWAYTPMRFGADIVVCSAGGALSSDAAEDGVGLMTATEEVWRRALAGCKQVCQCCIECVLYR
jgi:cysteine-S-conjugate beta-lyase